MSREIKFRAWNVAEKSFTPYVFINLHGVKLDPRASSPAAGGVWNPANIILEQFTGLLDKTGKEIFDGDILKNYQAPVNEVFWFDDGSWCMKNYHAKALLLSAYNTASEIIGNIHENTDLLKGETV